MKAKAYAVIAILILLGLYAMVDATVEVIQWQGDVTRIHRQEACDYYVRAQDDAFFAEELEAFNCK